MSANPPLAPALLGALGLIPFLGLAAAALLADAFWSAFAADAVLLYGAVILSFLGGCRWGFACAGMGSGPRFRALLVAVAPALLAWGAAMAGGRAGLVLLAGGLLLLFAADESLTRAGGAPEWWAKLRAPLTILAAGSLIAAAS